MDIASECSRSRRRTQREKELLHSLVDNFMGVVESKKSDAKSIQHKNEAWEKISKEYNAMPDVQKLTVIQLKKLWQNMKTRAKTDISRERTATKATGGGPPPPEVDEISKKIYSAIPSQFDPLPNDFDGDFSGSTQNVQGVIIHVSDAECMPCMDSTDMDSSSVSNSGEVPIITTAGSNVILNSTMISQQENASLSGSTQHTKKKLKAQNEVNDFILRSLSEQHEAKMKQIDLQIEQQKQEQEVKMEKYKAEMKFLEEEHKARMEIYKRKAENLNK